MAKYRVFYAAVVTALFAGYLFFPGYFFWLALVSTLILPFFSLLLTWLAIRNSAPQLTCDQPSGRKGSPVDFIFLLSGRSRLPVARITLLLRIQSSLFFRKEHALLFAGPKVHPTDLRAILLHGGANPFLGLSRALFLYKKGSMQRLYGGPS